MINQEFTLLGKINSLRESQKKFKERIYKANNSNKDEFKYDNSEEEYGIDSWMGDLTF